jgi:ATP-dependent exoDNAse (exonuclease V) beta subunit
MRRDERGGLEWILDKPPSLLCARDASLREALRQEKARLAYQSLCRLYVGMTRAIRGLYIILPEKFHQRSEAELLKTTLGASTTSNPWNLEGATTDCLHETGDRGWFTHIHAPVTAAATAVPPSENLGAMLRRTGGQLQRRTPSGEEHFRVRGIELLSERRESARQFGTLVHELFASVPWLDGLGEDQLRKAWAAKGLEALPSFATAAPLVLAALAHKDIRSWFSLSGASREAWCEKSFDMLLDRDWITGTFDRVVLDRDSKGRLMSATILDFKTDTVPDEATLQARVRGYEPQLKLYRQAVHRLTGLPNDAIKAGFIIVGLPRLVWLAEK